MTGQRETNCTWKDCEEEGRREQRARGGKLWAVLCDAHDAELNRTIDLFAQYVVSAEKMLAARIAAHGGVSVSLADL